MNFSQYKRAVGVIADRSEVELALNELKEAGFPLHSVSVIARNGNEELKNMDGIPMWNLIKENKSPLRDTIVHNIDEDPIENTFQV